MSDLIIEFAGVMRAEVNTLNTIAQNNANINTNGYRALRSEITGDDFFKALNSSASENMNTTKIDNSSGSLAVTGRPYDFAVVGDAWFGIQTDDGIYLTRNGSFNIDKNGILVNQTGNMVVGESGAIEGFGPQSKVDSMGLIVNANGSQDAFKLFKVDDSRSLQSIGAGLYKSDKVSVANENFKIVQEAIENSNVDLAEDMVRVMKTTRHIETLQRAMSSYDQILDIGINQIGK